MMSSPILIIFISLIAVISSQLVTAPPQYKGAKGEPGDTGFPGPQGAQGVSGSRGTKGNKGSIGAAGATGDPGADGSIAAVVGSKGQQGVAGDPGVKGPTGDIGPTGVAGPVGATGEIGQIGSTGPRGATGAKGVIGEVGATGNRGGQGPRGDPGIKGDAGATGEMGFNGPQGPKGAFGFPFTLDAGTAYTDGCLAVPPATTKKICGDNSYCEDRVDSVNNIVSGECVCRNGYLQDNDGKCVLVTEPRSLYYISASNRNCSLNNGGCEQICTDGVCYCNNGFRLTKQGDCVDIDECQSSTTCEDYDKGCLNLPGSYKCLGVKQLPITGRVTTAQLVNEQVVLALIIWFSILLIITFAILIVLCCLPDVALTARSNFT